MLLKNKGFFLIELLLSLSALIMIFLTFIPLLIDLKNQAWKLEIEQQSYQFLYEELQASIINGQTSPTHSISRNGIEYQISWRDTAVFGLKEVCIKVENPLYFEEKKCIQSE